MSNKQSSVEWLIIEIMQHQKTFYGVASIPFWLVEQAKEMHKEEIARAYQEGLIDSMNHAPKDYYNETFGGNNEQ